jgi:protein required for attachment to host cells
MTTRAPIWILIVDDRRARLMQGRAMGSARAPRLALSPVAELENGWAELDRDRPSRTNRDEPLGRRAELTQRYVSDLQRWITQQVRSAGIGELDVFAGPGLMVPMRRAWPNDLTVNEHERELGRLERGALEGHDAILGLVRRAAG